MPDSNAGVRDRLLLRPIVPITIQATAADVTLVTKAVLLCGWSLRETTGGGAASCEFRTGDASTGAILGEQALASAGTGSQWLGDEGVLAESGVVVHRVAGTFTGTIWIRI